MRDFVGDQPALLLLYLPVANIPDNGRRDVVSIDMLSAQAYLDREFCSVLSPSKDLAPGSHRPPRRNIRCKKLEVFLTVPIMKTLRN